jgi:catechol 2,3-dioxygenase-like lactoylglutathione lyase family enzyme
VLTNAPLVAFIATTDLARANTFYGDMLGLTAVETSPFASVYDANGTTLRISLVAEMAPAPYTVLGWNVGGLDDLMASLTQHGVTFERFPEMEQDSRGVWTAPSGARIAWFTDPDGNVLSLTEL